LIVGNFVYEELFEMRIKESTTEFTDFKKSSDSKITFFKINCQPAQRRRQR
jgi:hypothetical protein